MTYNIRNPLSVGEVIAVLIKEQGITQSKLAAHIRISQPYLSDLLKGKRSISPELAVKFSKALGSTPQTWLNLQNNWLLSRVDYKKIGKIGRLAA